MFQLWFVSVQTIHPLYAPDSNVIVVVKVDSEDSKRASANVVLFLFRSCFLDVKIIDIVYKRRRFYLHYSYLMRLVLVQILKDYPLASDTAI